jgi:hypothetical protein
MSLDAVTATAVLAAVESHALALGYFDRVNTHEPKSAPGNGVTCSIWVERINPVVGGSGLDSTTGRVELSERVQIPMLSEPQDTIDLRILVGIDALMAAYSANFTLGGLVRNVDLMGEFGDSLSAEAGYIEQDSRIYRVMHLTLPLIINDLYPQAP